MTLNGTFNTELKDSSIVKLVVGVLGYEAEMEGESILKRTSEDHEVAMTAELKMGRRRVMPDWYPW